ncbi:MAG: flagellar hook-associated protein FlgL [Eubacteriales bacterium]|nr:flagellar hook-associated protein FlgL [Eubacteriales bacterium]
MRITNSMMLNNYLSNLNDNLESLTEKQTQVSTGKRINKLSDDPVGLISVMQCDVKLYKTEQYNQNVENALTWLDQTEAATLSLNDVIKTAYETVIELANDYVTAEDKEAAAEMIAQLRDEVLAIGNSQSEDEYLFGGYNINNTPFTVDASGNILYNGLDLTDETSVDLIAENEQVITYEIGYETTMDISISGSELFGMGEDNIYTVFDNLYNALISDADAEELNDYIEKLQDNQSSVLAIEAKIGGRINRLELVQNRYEEDYLSYTELKSNIEDVDLAEAAMNYEMAETVYTAALNIGSKIIQLSLVDFLN